jgi:hypothetical protein
MAGMAAMAVMTAVLSSTGIRDYGNRTIHRQDTLGSSTVGCLAVVHGGVAVNMMSTPLEEIGSTSNQHPWRSSGLHSQRYSGQHWHHQDEYGSTSASLGCFRSNFVTSQPVASQADRQILWYGIWIAYERWVGNGPQILGRCQQARTKPPGSAVVGPSEEYVGYEICD